MSQERVASRHTVRNFAASGETYKAESISYAQRNYAERDRASMPKAVSERDKINAELKKPPLINADSGSNEVAPCRAGNDTAGLDIPAACRSASSGAIKLEHRWRDCPSR
jgi:hypothetical protein